MLLITSAKEGMIYRAFVCFVCLLATSYKNYWLDLHENLTGEVSLDREVTIKFWNLSGSVSVSRIFCWISPIPQQLFELSVKYFPITQEVTDKFLFLSSWGAGCLTRNKPFDFDADRIRITIWIQEFLTEFHHFSMDWANGKCCGISVLGGGLRCPSALVYDDVTF